MEKIPALSLRKKLGEYLNRVKYQNEIFIVERSGEPIALIVSLDNLGVIKGSTPKEIDMLLADKSNSSEKKTASLKGSIELLGDIEEGSKEIANQFQKSLKNTTKKL